MEKSVYDGRTYKERDGVFYYEDQLTMIAAAPITQTKCDFPEAVGVDECAFSYCSELSSVHLPGVRFIGKWGFSHCKSLKSFPSMANVVIMEEGVFCGSGIKQADLSSLLNIPFAAFSNCKELETVKLNENLRSIDEDSFASCEKLTAVELPESLKDIGQYSFYGTGLEEVVIPKKIRNLNDGVFGGCESLRCVILSEGVETIGDCAFIGCKELKSIFLPVSVERIHKNAFSDSLKIITCYSGSYAEQWARKNRFAVKTI